MARLQSSPRYGHHFPTRLGVGVVLAIALLLSLWLLMLLLPWLLAIAALGAVIYCWRRQRAYQNRLYTCFYQCLQAHQGRISVLDFAMAAHIPGPQARAFLDARARDFFADFEPTAYGDILYTFRRSSDTSMPLPPA
jgi:hypothetical protein